MKDITINISGMGDMGEIHDYIKDVLRFPEYYGANLDALHDMLTDIGEDVSITLVCAKSRDFQGAANHRNIRQVFMDAVRENGHLRFIDRVC